MERKNEKYTIRQLGGGDADKAEELVRVLRIAFGEAASPPPPKAYLKNLLESGDMLIWVAMAGEAVVGGLTGHVLPSIYAESSEFFIYDIGILPAHQGQGLGRDLLEAVGDYCGMEAIEAYFVDAVEEDEAAGKFYRAVGGKELPVIQFTFSHPR